MPLKFPKVAYIVALVVICLSLLNTVTFAHAPIDCFSQSVILGKDLKKLPDSIVLGNDESKLPDYVYTNTDLDRILQLTSQHLLTSIKVCTDRAVTYVKGVQANYGLFNS